MTGLRREIVVGLGALILITLTFGAGYLAFLKDKERHKVLTGQVSADITRVYARRGIDPESGAEHLVDISVTYKYLISRQVENQSNSIQILREQTQKERRDSFEL